MARIRLRRVAEQMKQVIARVVTQELKDPRCGFITITRVEVAPDLKTAPVDFSVLGSGSQKRNARTALKSARGYIQNRVAQQTVLRHTPVISFKLDESAERDVQLVQKINQIVESDRRAHTARAIRSKVAAGSIPPEVIHEISEAAASKEFAESLAGLLMQLIRENTTTGPHPAGAAGSERACLQIIEAELKRTWAGEIETELLPMGREIQNDMASAQPNSQDPDEAPGSSEQAHAQRVNLLAVLRSVKSEDAQPSNDEEIKPLRLVFNTHIDTAPPHVPPSRRGDIIRGRGACDAKGQAAMIVGAFQLLKHIRDQLGVRLLRDICAQFVVGAETGGSGSLSLALRDPFAFDGVVVCEPTGLRVCIASPGTVGYKAELTAPPGRAAELAADVVLALEEEGRSIRVESDHPLVPRSAAYTNHDILGPFGTAPATAPRLVEVEISSAELGLADIRHAAERGVGKYCALYGDKARESDPDTGRPAIAEHFTVERSAENSFLLRIRGKAGHAAAPALCDSAVTKAAYVVREFSELRASGKSLDVALAGHCGDEIILEGAQGFLPTHKLGQISERVDSAAERGVHTLCARAALEEGSAAVKMSFDSRQRAAFARDPDSALAVYMTETCKRAGPDLPTPAASYEAPSDASVFAELFPERDIVVFGPGRLESAHPPGETNSLKDIARGASILALLALESAGFGS